MEEDFFARINDYIKPKTPQSALEDHEVDTLIISLAETRGSLGFTEDEVIELIRWAEGVRVNESLLSLTLKGLTRIDWDSESKEPKFKSTELGNQIVKEL